MTDSDDAGQTGRVRASAVSQGDRDRTLEALHALEAAVGRPASSRSETWADAVRSSLEHLESAFGEQRASYDDPSGLMAEIAHDDPRLRTWVRQLRRRWAELETTTRTLRESLGESADPQAPYDVRERVRWLSSAIRHHREREADLVFDALEIDLGAPDDT